MSLPYSALLHPQTAALLALNRLPYIITTLSKSPKMEYWGVHGVNWPNYRKAFPIEKLKYCDYPDWTWDEKRRFFSPTPKDIADGLREMAVLAMFRCRALWEMTYEISASRYWLWRGPLLQDKIFTSKQIQAQKFKDAGYPEEDIIAYPYILQFAELSDLSMKEAADEILLKAQFDEEYLLWSEYIRLKYTKRLHEASDSAEIKEVLRQFHNEAYFRGPI